MFTTLKSLKPETLSPEEARAAWRGLHLILTAFGMVLPEEKTEEIPDDIRTLPNPTAPQ